MQLVDYIALDYIPDIMQLAGVGMGFGVTMPFAMRLIAYVIDTVRTVVR